MQITIDPTIGSQGTWADGVRRANNILAQLQEHSFEPVSAAWMLTYDQRMGPRLKLTLSDFLVSVEDLFVPEELQDAEHLWSRLNRLWDNLLEVRLRKLLERIRVSLQASGEGKDAR